MSKFWHRFLSILPIFVGLCLLFAAAVFIHSVFKTISLVAVLNSFWETDPAKIVLSLIFTACSFLALCIYDIVSVQLIGRPIPALRAAIIGATSYAFSQALGFGTLSGGAVRYRLYSALGLSAEEIAQIVVLSSLTFALGATSITGLALLGEADHFASLTSVPRTLLQIGGGGLIIGIICFLTWRAVQPRSLAVFGLALPLPSLPGSLGQILLGSSDVICSAAALWVLLPETAAISLPAFAGLYAALTMTGVLLHIPGSLGLLEAGMLLALPEAGKADVLSAVLLFRVIYYLLPFLIAALGLGVVELIPAVGRIARPGAPAARLLHAAAPPVMTALIFVSGIILLFSGATPALGYRMDLLKEVIPLPFVELSHLIGSLIGLALLVLASGLKHRIDSAWAMAVVLLVVGIVVSLLKGLDIEEAVMLGIVLIIALLARPAFYRKSSLLHDRPSPLILLAIVLSAAASIWLTLLAFSDVPYSSNLWWQVAWDAQAPRSIRAGLIVSVLTFAYAILLILRPSHPKPAAQDDIMPIIRQVLGQSTTPDSNLALTGDKRFLLSDNKDSFVMYAIHGNSWIAMGDPVGHAAAFERLVWKYMEMVDQFAGRPIFYEVTANYLPLYLDAGLSLMKIGEEAIVDLTTFGLEGGARANLRHSVNRAERTGLSFEVIPKEKVEPILPELQSISNAWLAMHKGREKVFSVGRFAYDYLVLFDLAVVRQEAAILGFANIWRSAKGGLSIDLMRYKPDAPNGLMDFLFCKLMLWGRAQGFRQFHLGMAPLAGLQSHPLAPTWHRAGHLLFAHGEELYGFAGLRAYKDKFRPAWHPRYLAAPGGLSLPSVIFDLAMLISSPRAFKPMFTRGASQAA